MMQKLTKLTTRVLATLIAVFATSGAWAGLPTITVSGNDVTISNDSGSHGNIGTNNGGYDTLTIPAATDLASGTVLRIKSISFGVRTGSWSETQKPAATVTLAGVNSAAAAVTTSGYSDRDKYTYVFETPCLMKVGTGSTISFKNASGNQANVGLAASLTGSTDQDDYLFTTLRSTSGSNKWSVLTEIVAEKVTGYINETANGFNTTVTSDKVYVSGVTGYLNTPNGVFGNVNELVVVDGAYSFGHKIVNGNSPNAGAPNRFTAFRKLSGTGTITNGDHANQPTPVVGICDSSEFVGSINIGSGTTRPTILFCTEAEINAGIQNSLGSSLQSLFTSVDGRARIYVSPGRTTANNAVVTVPAGKTWTAVNGIENRGELVVNGTVSCKIVNSGTLTVNGTVTGTISGSGTVVVNEGATIASFGSRRSFTGWTIDSSIPVKITMTSEEYGKGSVSVTGASGISSITVFAPDGTTEVTTLTPENGEATYDRGSVLVSGKACWCDYEMDYVSGTKTGFENTGTDATVLSGDGVTGDDAFYNGMLYTYAHPWRDITYPSDGNWTAVVRCTVPAYENAAVITFGTKDGGLIGLVAGEDPETQMRLVQTTGNSHFVTNATMTVQNATTAQHVYIFSVEGNQTVKVYCDGDQVLNKTFDSQFTIGGGIQVGSVHGGVGNTGIIRFAKNESPANTLSETVQKDARIDCVRLYNYLLSAEQIAALSVEFPAVKLYRATVAANANTDWNSLTWSPSWDGGNSSSKIILTVEGDASLTLPDSITANEFVMNVPAANVLTLSKASGGTALAVTEPIEVAGGTLYFNPGISQPIGLGDLNIGGTGTVRLGNGTLVNNSISGSANVELLSDASVIMFGGSISNPIKGAGLLDYSYGNSLPSGLSFGDWSGTVKLPGFTADALNLNSYGKSGSVVEITAVNGGWIAEAGKTVAPTLKLSGNMTIDAMSSWTYTFAEITGSGNLSFSTSANSPTVNITKVAEGYSGTISSTLANPVTIATLDRQAGTTVTPGTKVLSTSSGVQASALTVGGEATGIIPVFDTDGLYVKAASVTKNDTTTFHDTVVAALTTAGSDAATITLLAPTDSAIALAPGQTLVNGNLTTGAITSSVNGYEVSQTGSTYTLVDNRTSTWTGTANDGSWTNGENWSTGIKPSQYTDVTFPDGDSAITLTANNGSEACKSITLNGNLTLQYSGDSWVEFYMFGGVSGTGTLTLSHVCLNNRTNDAIEISSPVVIAAVSGDSAFLGTGSWIISGPLTVNGYLKAQTTPVTVSGATTFAASGVIVETQANITITGTTTFNGNFSRDTTYGVNTLTFGNVTVAAPTTIAGTKPTTFSGTVTLNVGASLTVANSFTVSSVPVAANSNYTVNTEVGASTKVYSLVKKPGTIFSVY